MSLFEYNGSFINTLLKLGIEVPAGTKVNVPGIGEGKTVYAHTGGDPTYISVAFDSENVPTQSVYYTAVTINEDESDVDEEKLMSKTFTAEEVQAAIKEAYDEGKDDGYRAGRAKAEEEAQANKPANTADRDELLKLLVQEHHNSMNLLKALGISQQEMQDAIMREGVNALGGL